MERHPLRTHSYLGQLSWRSCRGRNLAERCGLEHPTGGEARKLFSCSQSRVKPGPAVFGQECRCTNTVQEYDISWRIRVRLLAVDRLESREAGI
jgi:hypothetical protein